MLRVWKDAMNKQTHEQFFTVLEPRQPVSLCVPETLTSSSCWSSDGVSQDLDEGWDRKKNENLSQSMPLWSTFKWTLRFLRYYHASTPWQKVIQLLILLVTPRKHAGKSLRCITISFRGLENSHVLSDQTVKDAEEFVCKVYGAANASNTNEVRVSMYRYVKAVTNDKLPHTSDALLYHIKRSHYQALVSWRQADVQHPLLLPPETIGWRMEETSLISELSSLPPVPKACEELISCTCSTGCRTKLCSCKKAKIQCNAFCMQNVWWTMQEQHFN